VMAAQGHHARVVRLQPVEAHQGDQ